MIDTKQKILDTAEKMFGEQGIEAVSLRQIIAEAGVNLAAVHYHFGSKQELLDAVISRKAGPVNVERLVRLEKLQPGPNGRLSIVEVLEAFMMPMAEAAALNPQFVCMMGRIQAEGLLYEVIRRNFNAMLMRFLVALRSALPDLPEEEFRWRVHFMQGAMAQAMSGQPAILSGPDEPHDFPLRIRRLIQFVAAGFEAPTLKPVKVRKRK